MIIPEMRGTFESALLRSSSRELADVLNTAYSRAVTVNQLHRVRIDTATGRYFIERRSRKGDGENGFVAVKDLPGGEGKIDGRISIEMGKQEPKSEDAADASAPAEPAEDSRTRGRGNAIAFYSDGTADAMEIRLRDRDGFRVALQINPITARVEIVELERN
jgi:Tfp pilus assembly protein FimT